MHRYLLLALLGFAAPAALSTAPQTSGLPSAQELVSRHVAAIGGEAAFKAVKSMRQRGTVEMVAEGISGEFDVMLARPAKLLQRISVPTFGQFEQGYDGKVAWSIDPQSGPAVMAGRELTEIAEDAWFDAPLHQASRLRSLETLERTEFDGRPAFKVKAVFLSGVEQIEYFDAEKSFEIGWEASRATPNGILPTIAKFREYKRFGALMLPSVVLMRQLGADQTMRLTSCEFNSVPSSAFDLPKPIKALILIK
jgi:hypothetical protein